MAILKFLRLVAGIPTETPAIAASAGAADADKIPQTNADGVLDASLLNAANASTGAPDGGKIAQLDAAGRLDSTMMPVGIGADTASITTSEALAAGDKVNIHDVGGAARVRKADATTAGKEAHGFVLAAFGAAVQATVYFEGTNTAVTGLTPGPQYLSTTAGKTSHIPPAAAGNVVQLVGVATGATALNFEKGQHYVLA